MEVPGMTPETAGGLKRDHADAPTHGDVRLSIRVADATWERLLLENQQH
jgi:hypothetical protein